jgi:hypothetical protein
MISKQIMTVSLSDKEVWGWGLSPSNIAVAHIIAMGPSF